MEFIKEETVIGFIGTGVMGTSMARNLLKAGYPVHVYTRTKKKAEELIQEGCIWRNSISQLAGSAKVIITMVGDPTDVKEVYFGEFGIFQSTSPGTYLIDMSSSSPMLAKEIHQEALQYNLFALDAPVSGGDIGARDGKLAIMVGGDRSVFEAMRPIFSVLGENLVLQGEAGAGQHTKICNQVAAASTMIGVCEALVYAEKAGLDQTAVLKSIETGAAGSWSLSNLGPKMIAGNFEPGFFVKHFIKDMLIALESAKEMGLNTPGLELAKNMYVELSKSGEDTSGTQALIKLYKINVERVTNS
ncbi:NAD(P)-dependent oxidoreductase [Peribacillus cavernae]|uniref:NAD(P)-dependent oxidoreductase n=1 Tax=Peribacillus cavernae TaxID=1674310 RepID=A0A3S0W308_9BACI|nr:NAD(P)-dependent oxidoreductase [Peribacillus cavernae]MDQ0221040.1 3-hydroxyisobutyrate dehydrogenase [Peribacillus cavernae]RUQ25817.1 NAD(P)-dependent oxidoreductase [Peribacillus cavernae]